MSALAVYGSVAFEIAISSGTLPNVPSTPNAMSTGLRPMRSESAPITGCINTNASSVTVEMMVDCSFVKPTVVTRYFCM